MTSRGRPVLALDIGGTKLAVAVVTDDGHTHGLLIEPTHRESGPDEVIRHLFDMGRRAIATAGVDEVAAVGISCGGPLDAASGVLLGPLHLPGWDHVPIVSMAEDAFGVPAVLGNDASVGALAESRYGAAVGRSTVLYLTVSTGIGGGAVIDGHLHQGAAGNGGEFGHVLVRSDGRPCLCGRHGCLEGYASGGSIARRAQEALATGADSSLAALETVRAEDVVAAAQAGDRLAGAVWDETVELLAVAVTDLVNVFEPDVVVLGGGVTRSGDALFVPLRAAVDGAAMPPAAAAVRIEPAALGDAVCVVGAACIAFDLLDGAPDEAPSAHDTAAPSRSSVSDASSRPVAVPDRGESTHV